MGLVNGGVGWSCVAILAVTNDRVDRDHWTAGVPQSNFISIVFHKLCKTDSLSSS